MLILQRYPGEGQGGTRGIRGVHREVNVSREGTGRINFSRGKGPTGRTPPGGTGRGHPLKGGDRKEPHFWGPGVAKNGGKQWHGFCAPPYGFGEARAQKPARLAGALSGVPTPEKGPHNLRRGEGKRQPNPAGPPSCGAAQNPERNTVVRVPGGRTFGGEGRSAKAYLIFATRWGVST